MGWSGAGERVVHLRQRPEVGTGKDDIDVRRVGDDPAAGIDGIGVARRTDLRPVDRFQHGAEVDVRNDHALARFPLGDRDRHVWAAVASGW